MQLISTLLFILSLILLAGAVLFIRLWHRSRKNTSPIKLVREGFGHIGISAIVEYPETTAPLLSLLDEEYPHSEAIIVTDLQRNNDTFGELVRNFRLTKVNHSDLKWVRALYRSRRKMFRRVVVIDLPTEERSHATAAAKKVASFDYILRLQGECCVAHNALTYCANIIALHPTTKALKVESIIGANARLERADATAGRHSVRVLSNKALAWRKSTPKFLILAISLPAVIIYLAHISGHRLFAVSAGIIAAILIAFIYISCRVVSEKAVYSTTDTIIKNFYRFLVEHIKIFHYLYKERNRQDTPRVERVELLNKIQDNRE